MFIITALSRYLCLRLRSRLPCLIDEELDLVAVRQVSIVSPRRDPPYCVTRAPRLILPPSKRIAHYKYIWFTIQTFVRIALKSQAGDHRERASESGRIFTYLSGNSPLNT